MIYRKGELSPAAIDRGWPHQVALPASACKEGGYKLIHEFCKGLSICPRGHSVFHDGEWFNVYCFAEACSGPDYENKIGTFSQAIWLASDKGKRLLSAIPNESL